ncbi:MAG: HAMP domain-containing histidine kinase [Proteobacteria bacterium]|nr:HAMP domain-containing histidine kinase [Pseudomonadota bacterium]
MQAPSSDCFPVAGGELATGAAGQPSSASDGFGFGDRLTRRVEELIAELRPDHQAVVQTARQALYQQLSNKLSHELHNPLCTLRLSNYVLRRALASSDPQLLATLDRIERSIVRCDRVMEELFYFTRIAAIDPQPAVLDVWLARIVEEQAPPPSISVRFGLPGTKVPIDKDRLRRAVVNVFENAYEALGEGAADSPVCEQLVVLYTGESNHRIEIVVEDNGPGIPADVLPRIFEPLYSTKGFGMGLGLPVARQIMALHGGGIEIETEEGCGTRVCLWLPSCGKRESTEKEGNKC